ncbi:MAG: cupin domain-containing protein [Actinomycetota bacterium]
MQHWSLAELNTPDGARSPQVLHSQEGEARVVAIHLQEGQELGDHQVKEAALLVVADGRVRIEAGDESVDAAPGHVFRFEPNERHAVVADGDARVLLILAPWPGEGHYRGEEPVSASSPDARA